MPESQEKQVEFAELAVRRLRDKVYGVTTNDNNWQYCKVHWMRPDSVRWLTEKSKIPIKSYV